MSEFYARAGLNIETYDARTEPSFGGTGLVGDAAWYAERAREWGGPVLEAACGTGRVAWAVADAGLEVTGFDLHASMLAVAESRRAAHPGARATFVQANLLDVDLGRRFRTVLVPFRGFQCLLTPQDQAAALGRLRDHLEDEGRLVVNLFDPVLEYLLDGSEAHSGERWRGPHPERGTTVVVDVSGRRNDPFHQVLRETWTFRELDARGQVVREEAEELAMRWTYRWEARHLFARCGLEVEAEYGDFSGAPPAYGREQVWVLRGAR